MKKEITIDQIEQYLNPINDFETIAKSYYIEHGKFMDVHQMPDELIHQRFYILPIDLRNANLDAFLSEHMHDFSIQDQRIFPEQDHFMADSDINILVQPRYMCSPMTSHLFFELCYQYNGNSTIIFPMGNSFERIEMSEGDFLMIPYNQPHAVSVKSDGILLNIGVRRSTLEDALLKNLPSNSLFGQFFTDFVEKDRIQSYILFHTSSNTEIRRQLQQIMVSYCTPSIYSRQIVNLQLNVLLLTLMQRFSHDARISYDGRRIFPGFSEMIHFIEQHYTTTSVAEVAETFGYSSDYINSVFKKMTGHTIGDMILSLKLEKAALLLKNTTLSVDDISENLGYRNTTNLIRSFKKYFQLTPAQYRKKNS